MKTYFLQSALAIALVGLGFGLSSAFDISITYVLIVLAIPYVLISFRLNKKATQEAQKKTTLYQKERIIQKGSPAANYLNAFLICMWIIGVVFLFSELFMPGVVILGLAFLWTRKKIQQSKIENFETIITPAHWPKDCQYANYNQGLQAKTMYVANTKDRDFYQRCKAEGIQSIEGARNEQKALLIAQSMKRKDTSMEALRAAFDVGKLSTENIKAESQRFDKEQALSKIRIDELEVLAGAMKYYGLHGKEKRIAMLQDMYDEAKKAMKEAEFMRSYAQHNMLQKEHDWAIHGGIASGIAGPAAGLVTAMQTEAKNAAIRQYNAQMAPYVQMLTSSYSGQASAHQAQMNRYRADMEKTKIKLVSDDSTQVVFKNLHITNMNYAISETGAVVVEADFSVATDYRIFESVHPTIDGIVAARLMENGEHVGSAYFVFPVDGVHRTVRLASICTKTTNPSAEYTIEYEPVDLWAMEKL